MNDITSKGNGEGFLEQYDVLQKSGLLAQLESLLHKNTILQKIIFDMTQLASCADTNVLFDLIIGKTLDFLVSRHLIFMIRLFMQEGIEQYYFKDLKMQHNKTSESTFHILKSYFDSASAPKVTGRAVKFQEIKNTLNDIDFDEDFLQKRPTFIMPLFSAEGAFGFVIVGEKITGEDYSEDDFFYVQQLLTIFSLSLQNKINYKSAITDQKTGLFTYEYFQKRLQERLAAARRKISTSAVLMLDLDHFKVFNDTYGHLAGDKALVALSGVLKKSVREEDCVCRFGGEEFLILLSDCNGEFLFNVAERIRGNIEKLTIEDAGRILKITASIGGCMIDSTNIMNVTQIVKCADDALYTSKQNGRNCTTIV